MLYIAVDIGCIECGQDSNILGVFTNKEEAESILLEHEERQKKDWHGQHSFEIFEIEEIDKEYKVEYTYDWEKGA